MSKEKTETPGQIWRRVLQRTIGRSTEMNQFLSHTMIERHALLQVFELGQVKDMRWKVGTIIDGVHIL